MLNLCAQYIEQVVSEWGTKLETANSIIVLAASDPHGKEELRNGVRTNLIANTLKMPTTSVPEAVVKRNVQRMERNRYDLIGKGLDFHEGTEIGLLRLDLNRKHAECYNLAGGIEELEKRLLELDDWTYEIGQIYTSLDDVEPLEGDFYYRDEDVWKFECDSYGFSEFSEKIFGEYTMKTIGCGLVLDKYARIVL